MTNEITDRDPETGRILSKKLDSETAREMGKRSHKKRRTASADQLLTEAGYVPGEEPEHLRVLSEIAASQSSGSVPAMRDFLKLTSHPDPETKSVVKPGDRCPACQQYVTNYETLDQDELMGFIMDYRKQHPTSGEFSITRSR